MDPKTDSILCPVDFSPGSERVLDHAAELANLKGAVVELLHVYRIPVLSLPEGEVTATPEYVANMLDNATQALDELRTSLATRGIRTTTRLIAGEPVATILERAAELGASLIVLGTHGRGGFKHMILGSVAERVVRTSSIPVLTVRLAPES
jgi:nucleotide-binding universal stress UspA family protein